MSFQIGLYTMYSDKTEVVKQKELIIALDGVLKDNTSIVDPVILVTTNISTLAECNYMSIPSFNREYFVTDLVSVRNNLTEIHAHCDVLSSFWDYIKTNEAITYRQEQSNNLYLDDGDFKVYQNPNIILKSFPDGFKTQSFILALAGPG